MSWDAYLKDVCITCGHSENCGTWNYTHNCNNMISEVVKELGYELERHWLIDHMGESWFHVLDGLTGKDGSAFLAKIIEGLEANPERFQAMNPDNGWGSYETLLPVLRAMRNEGLKNPAASWRVNG